MRHAPWLVLALSLAACAANPPPPKSGPLGVWSLSEFRLDADQPSRTPVVGVPFTLILDQNGGASGEAACNRWEGRYITALGKLSLERVAVGRERCLIGDAATAQLAQVFISRLESGAEYQTDGQGLELVFADDLRWRFRRK